MTALHPRTVCWHGPHHHGADCHRHRLQAPPHLPQAAQQHCRSARHGQASYGRLPTALDGQALRRSVARHCHHPDHCHHHRHHRHRASPTAVAAQHPVAQRCRTRQWSHDSALLRRASRLPHSRRRPAARLSLPKPTFATPRSGMSPARQCSRRCGGCCCCCRGCRCFRCCYNYYCCCCCFECQVHGQKYTETG